MSAQSTDQNNLKDFTGLTAIVTGAGSGIGLSVAKILSARGAKVFGFDIQPGEMKSYATYIECDIGSDRKSTRLNSSH